MNETQPHVIDELVYQSYKYQRDYAPHATPNDWRPIFGDQVDALEARYQRELSQV